MELNSREIAILAWGGLVLAAALWHENIRGSLFVLVKAFFHRKIITVVGLLYAYLGFVVGLLFLAGLWDWDQLKNTLIVSVAAGIASILRLPNAADDPKLYRRWIADNLRIVAIVEFIVTFYTFPFILEFILVPVLAAIGGMLAVGEREEKYAPAVTFLNGLLVMLGALAVVYAAYELLANPGTFWSLQTVRDFSTPIILSLTLLPFIQLLHIYAAYEETFTRLEIFFADRDLQHYAKRRVIYAFGPSVALLHRWSRNVAIHRPDSKREIDASVREVFEARRRERHPPDLPPSQGWAPHIAKEYLTNEGLVTGDYHRTFDEWHASSPMVELGEGLLPDNVAYYVEGDRLAVRRLKLVLNVNNPGNAAKSERTFLRLAQILVQRATGYQPTPENVGEFEVHTGDKHIEMRRTEWKGGIPAGYDLSLKIGCDKDLTSDHT